METLMEQTVCKRPKKQITAVDLAKDVIKLLKTRKIKTPPCENGSVYVSLPEIVKKPEFIGQSMRKVMHTKAWEPCTICALGALFVAHVDYKNDVELDGMTGQFNQHRKHLTASLFEYFSVLQLHLIETAYEQKIIWNETEEERRALRQVTGIEIMHTSAIQFGLKFPDRRKRLIAIMQNIVDNGKFCPPLITE